MGVNTIDANMLKNMFLAGAKRMEAKKEWINELNVFPVPDGDTGTNMTHDDHVSGTRSECSDRILIWRAFPRRFPREP